MAKNYYGSLYSCCLVFIFHFACTVWDSADSLLFHRIKFNVAICRNLLHLHTNISTCIQIHNLNLFANTFATNKFQPSTYHQYFFTWLTINLFFLQCRLNAKLEPLSFLSFNLFLSKLTFTQWRQWRWYWPESGDFFTGPLSLWPQTLLANLHTTQIEKKLQRKIQR